MTNPIILTLSNKSLTAASVASFSDSAITLTGFSLNSPQPIVEAARNILKQVGSAARPYKLQVKRSNTSIPLFTVRSVYWASRKTIRPDQPDYEIIDQQFLIDR